MESCRGRHNLWLCGKPLKLLDKISEKFPNLGAFNRQVTVYLTVSKLPPARYLWIGVEKGPR